MPRPTPGDVPYPGIQPAAPALQGDSLPLSHLGSPKLIVVVVLVAKLCPTLAAPWSVARQASLSMGFPRQEYWSGLPFLSPGNFPKLGTEPGFPALQAAIREGPRMWRRDRIRHSALLPVFEIHSEIM